MDKERPEGSPAWAGSAMLDVYQRLLVRAFFIFGPGISKKVRIANAMLIPVDFAIGRRTTKLSHRAGASVAESAIWALTTDGAEFTTATGTAANAYSAFRFGGLAVPLPAAQIAVTAAARKARRRPFESGSVVAPVAGFVGGLLLRTHERTRVNAVREDLRRRVADGLGQAQWNAEWDAACTVLRSDGQVFSVSDFLGNDVRMLIGHLDLSSSLRHRLEGKSHQSMPSGAAPVRFVLLLGMDRHNERHPQLEHQWVDCPTADDELAETFITPRQQAELVELLSEHTIRVGAPRNLRLLRGGGYGRRVVLSVDGTRVSLSPDYEHAHAVPETQAMVAALGAGVVWCLMDSTTLAGLLPRRLSVAGAAAMAVSAVAAQQIGRRRDLVNSPLPLFFALVSAGVHAVSAAPTARREPIAPHNLRRRTPITQAMYPAAALLGYTWRAMNPRSRVARGAIVAAVAAGGTAAVGRPFGARDQLINWSFVISAFGAAYRFRMWSERASAHLLSSLGPAADVTIADITRDERRREWASLAADIREAALAINSIETHPDKRAAVLTHLEAVLRYATEQERGSEQ